MEMIKETEWINLELKKLDESALQGQTLPALKLEEGKVYDFDIDFTKAFDEWKDPATQAIKKIIPILHEGVRKVFWLNVRNPLYKQIMEKGKAGQRKFKIVRVGTAKATKYSIMQ